MAEFEHFLPELLHTVDTSIFFHFTSPMQINGCAAVGKCNGLMFSQYFSVGIVCCIFWFFNSAFKVSIDNKRYSQHVFVVLEVHYRLFREFDAAFFPQYSLCSANFSSVDYAFNTSNSSMTFDVFCAPCNHKIDS